MVEITHDMALIIKRAILSFVATVNEDGTPNLSPKAPLTVRNGLLYFADIASLGTVRNLRRNPDIEINVADIFLRRGYRFKGRASLLSPGHAEYAPVAEWVWATNGREYPVNLVVKIELTEVAPLLSPANAFAKPSLTEEQIKHVYYSKYGVHRRRQVRQPVGRFQRSIGTPGSVG